MSMDRRSFVKRLFGGAAAAVATTLLPETLVRAATLANGGLDMDRLLWVPGSKTLFIPDDVKVRGVELATNAQVAQVTGRHTIRVKSGHSIYLFTPEQFERTRKVAFSDGIVDIHFDDGTIAHGSNAIKESLKEAHERAIAASAANKAAFANRRPVRPMQLRPFVDEYVRARAIDYRKHVVKPVFDRDRWYLSPEAKVARFKADDNNKRPLAEKLAATEAGLTRDRVSMFID